MARVPNKRKLRARRLVARGGDCTCISIAYVYDLLARSAEPKRTSWAKTDADICLPQRKAIAYVYDLLAANTDSDIFLRPLGKIRRAPRAHYAPPSEQHSRTTLPPHCLRRQQITTHGRITAAAHIDHCNQADHRRTTLPLTSRTGPCQQGCRTIA